MRDELTRVHDEHVRELRELIRKKFAASGAGNNPLALALERSLAEILDRNVDILENMIAVLDKYERKSDVNSLFEVATVFAPLDRERELASRNFFRFPLADPADWTTDGASALAGPLFLNCPYSDMEKYLNKHFAGECAGKSFTYSLIPYYGYVNAENVLYAAARLYGVDRAVIYSPWSRRAVTVSVKNGPVDCSQMNLKLAENNLSGILLGSHILMWNISISTCERWDKSYRSPDGIDANFIYQYTSAGDKDTLNNEASFVVPEYADLGNPFNLSLIATKNGREIVIESQSELAKTFRIIDIYRPKLDGLPADCQLFLNACDATVLSSCSIPRSAGDINLVLSALKQPGHSGEYMGKSGERPTLIRYAAAHKYGGGPRRDSLISSGAGKKFPCRVRISGDAHFLEDFSEYALSYLAWRYPEYLWTGEAAQ